MWVEVNFSRDCSSSIWWWFITDKYGQVPDEEVLSLFFAKYDWAVAGYELYNELYKAAYNVAFYTKDYENEQYQDLATRLAPQYFVLVMENGSEHVEFTDHPRDFVRTPQAISTKTCITWSSTLIVIITNRNTDRGPGV